MPRVIIDRAAFTETLRLKDPDAFLLLEFLRFRHGGGAFDVHDEVRREMPEQGGWTMTRFAGTRGRLIAGGYLVVERMASNRPRRLGAATRADPATR
ncbi:hypothetical protein ABIB00_005043 [Bradyrhizobium sp. LB14.3]|uniref:hypothetical protein n=1 Tax=Bradyrhizobium sp. LB14.3 TaxID=3156328 RepID=UPI0033948743